MTPTTSKPLDRDKIDPAVRAAVNRVLNGLGRWPLVLWGNVGCGKTCAALLLLDHLCDRRWYWSAPDLVEELASAKRGELWYPGGGKRSTRDFWEDWRAYRCVCIDEIGTRREASDHAYETIKLAIDQREGKPAIYISNLSLNDLAAVYDERISSRLAHGTVVECDGEDRRLVRG